MPFTMPSFPLLNREQASPYADLISNALQNYGMAVEARYKPLTTQAEAASKLAYASLMAPQFLAKMMTNPDVRGNLSEDQLSKIMNTIYGAGTNQSDLVANLLKGFGGGSNQLRPSTIQQPTNISQNNSYQYDSLGNNVKATEQEIDNAILRGQSTNQLNPEEVQKAYRAYMETPEAQKMVNEKGFYQLPDENQIMDWYRKQQSIQQPINQIPQLLSEQKEPFAVRAGQHRGTIAQEEKLGEVRAKEIGEFNEQIEAGYNISDKYNSLKKLFNNPEFANLRNNIPLFQDKQLKVLSKVGTPYQQELIGEFFTTANEIVGDVIRSFGAQKFKGENDIASTMKPNENDTFNVMVGKVQAAMAFKDFKMQRNKIAVELMDKQKINKYKALEMADMKMDGDKIRKDIDNKLDYLVNIRIKRKDGTYELEKVKRSEARRRGVNV